MSYWNDFKNKFASNQNENLNSLKKLGQLLYDKTREGGSYIADATKEELEVLKLKYKLHKKHGELTNAILKIGDVYLDLQRDNGNTTLNIQLSDAVMQATQLEEECRKLEKELNRKNSDPVLTETKSEEPETTPY